MYFCFKYSEFIIKIVPGCILIVLSRARVVVVSCVVFLCSSCSGGQFSGRCSSRFSGSWFVPKLMKFFEICAEVRLHGKSSVRRPSLSSSIPWWASTCAMYILYNFRLILEKSFHNKFTYVLWKQCFFHSSICFIKIILM